MPNRKLKFSVEWILSSNDDPEPTSKRFKSNFDRESRSNDGSSSVSNVELNGKNEDYLSAMRSVLDKWLQSAKNVQSCQKYVPMGDTSLRNLNSTTSQSNDKMLTNNSISSTESLNEGCCSYDGDKSAKTVNDFGDVMTHHDDVILCDNSYNEESLNSKDAIPSNNDNNNSVAPIKQARPPYFYYELIQMAILNSPTRRLKVGEICDFIMDRFPYYRNLPRFQYCIRSNLSSRKCFVRVIFDIYF